MLDKRTPTVYNVTMQTFLPYPDFRKTVECLDFRRLGKQRVEARQILDVLTRKKTGWKNHPAAKMWVGYVDALISYSNFCITEWVCRGYKNNMLLLPHCKHYKMPWWFGNQDFHSSHRAALLEKDYSWYSQFGWKEIPNIDYVWPTKDLLTNSV